MYTSKASFSYVPITHIVLATTTTVLATALYSITYHQYIPLVVSCVPFLLCTISSNDKHIVPALLMIIFCTTTISRINIQQNNYVSHQNIVQKPITIIGTITEISQSTQSKQQSFLIVSIQSIKNKQINNPKPFLKKTLLYAPSYKTKYLQEGQTIRVNNLVLQQPKTTNSFATYLIKEGIGSVGHLTNQNITVLAKNNAPLNTQFQNMIKKHFSSTTLNLFNSLFLGKKERSSNSITTQHYCQYWGAAHHMARSGLHMVVLFSLLIFLLSYAQLSHTAQYGLCGIIVIYYFAISYPSISFMRAFFMIMLNLLSKLLKAIPLAQHIIGIATLIIVLYNPIQVLFLDFQLSFAITYIIIWLFRTKRSQTIAFKG